MKLLHIPPPVDASTCEAARLLAAELLRRPAGWATRLAIDTETTGLSIMSDHPVCWSLSDGTDRWYLDADALLDGAFDPLFLDKERCWVLANAKYDMHMLANFGVPPIEGYVYDVIGMSYMVDENNLHGLKAQAKRVLGLQMRDFKEVFNLRSEKDIARSLLDPANKDLVVRYATLDAYATWQLSEAHYHELRGIEFRGGYSAWDFYEEIELPFTKCLWRMERRGFLVDTGVVDALRVEFTQGLDDAHRAVLREIGRPINVMSTQQLQQVLYGDLKLTPLSYTDGGAPAVDAKTLETFAKRGVRAAQCILDYRKFHKLLGTYIDGHAGTHLGRDGRVHTTLRQFGTRTGRLASADPNMQNIPARSEEGAKIRGAFVAPPGHSLLVYDYSTLEMRVMAHMSRDQAMGGAIERGLDLHCFTASKMLGVTYEHALGAKILDDVGFDDTTGAAKKLAKKAGIDESAAISVVSSLNEDAVKQLLKARTASKTIGFGIMYGQGPTALGEKLGMTKGQATSKIDEWFSTFPRVREFIERAQRDVLAPPYAVRTLLGRFRHVPEAASSNRGKQAEAQRIAVNTPIQGSAGDIVKMAMLYIDQDPLLGGNRLEGGELGVQMILQVHDEIICEVPAANAAEAGTRVMAHMREPGFKLAVPLDVEGGAGRSWRDAK